MEVSFQTSTEAHQSFKAKSIHVDSESVQRPNDAYQQFLEHCHLHNSKNTAALLCRR